MATEQQQLPPSKRQRGDDLAVEEEEAEEIEPVTSLTDLPASVLMRIHDLLLVDVFPFAGEADFRASKVGAPCMLAWHC